MSQRRYEKPTNEVLRARLTPLEYEVTQNDATEPPFKNRYWDNHEEGLYVDAASGEPLFASVDKFESGTGWPSFTRPVEAGRVVSKVDESHGMLRTEVRSAGADSHLGHVFEDGPAPGGLRYCINSASLRFIPVAELEAQGYGEYKQLFTRKGETKGSSWDGTNNECAVPPPGKAPGCQATLETVVLAGCSADPRVVLAVEGVLDAEAVPDGLRVVFDPEKITQAELKQKATC